MLVGFASALRRSSLAALRLSDVGFGPFGATVHVRYEKQDQEGKGRFIGLPFGHAETCPVQALRAWLDLRGLDDGPLFTRMLRFEGWGCDRALAPQAIGDVVQAAVARIGLDPHFYGGHSLRAGFVTSAVEAGVGELLIAAQTGHRSMEILRQYFRRADLFRANACLALGL